MTLPSVFQTIPAAAERTHGRHSRARMTPSRRWSGSMPALRSPSPPPGSRPGRRRCRPSLRASAAEGGPDPRRRSDLRHGRQERAQGDDAAVRLPDHPGHGRACPRPPQPRQDDAEQKSVRIHAGALVAVSAPRIPPRTMTLKS